MNVMSTLAYILLFTFLGSIAALIGGIILLLREKFALKISHFLASFAAGVLLAAAFFDLLPEALHESEATGINIFLWAFIGKRWQKIMISIQLLFPVFFILNPAHFSLGQRIKLFTIYYLLMSFAGLVKILIRKNN